MTPRPGRHLQWDSRRSQRAAWCGTAPGFVLGVKFVFTSEEASTSFGGRYLSVWLGPMYCGVGRVW